MHQESAKNTQLLGSGQGAKVYLEVNDNGQKFAKKVFDPNFTARLGYRLFRLREHPYNTSYTDFVAKSAYELRRIAHGVSVAFEGAEIVDAVHLCGQEPGFYCPYVESVQEYDPQNRMQKKPLDKLEKHFLNIGLPVWSFGGYLKEERRKSNVLIGRDGKPNIVDYEAGWPYFNSQDIVGFDDVDALKFQRFLALGKHALIHRLGERKYLELMESWEKYQLFNTFWREEEAAPVKKLQAIKESFNWRSLHDRSEKLLEEGKISTEEADNMKHKIMADHHLLQKILPHFLAHFSTFVFLRFPLGSIARPTYTAAMRGIDEVSRLKNPEKRGETQIHDLKVILCSGIPVLAPPFNFFAYLTKALGEEPLSYLLLDNISYHLSGKGLEEQMEKLGASEKGRLLLQLQESSHPFVHKLGQAIESALGQIVSNEVVQRSTSALKTGCTQGYNPTEAPTLTRELVLATERAIEEKYLNMVTDLTL